MIAIIDYGMGNLRSVQKGFERVLGIMQWSLPGTLLKLSIERVMLSYRVWGRLVTVWPAVTRYGLVDPIHRAIQVGKPFLGNLCRISTFV